jgi:hypothetical protein
MDQLTEIVALRLTKHDKDALVAYAADCRMKLGTLLRLGICKIPLPTEIPSKIDARAVEELARISTELTKYGWESGGAEAVRTAAERLDAIRVKMEAQ